jgi:tetratricopeptide (TPR) repeat protein
MAKPVELKEQGLAFYRQEKYDEAAERFAQSAEAYATQGDSPAAAEARNNLAVVRLAQENWDAALAAVQGTPQIFAVAGDRLRQAQAIANLANAHEGAGHLDPAAENYERAIELFTELGETDIRAACWKALSGVQIKQDKKLQAMASMQAGLKLAPKLTPREKTLKGLLDQAFKLMGH